MLPRLFNDDPLTFDPNINQAVPGEVIADNTGPGATRVGIVREAVGGPRLVDLLIAEVELTLAVTTPIALTQRVTVTVTDRGLNPIAGALVQLAVSVTVALTAVAPGVAGTVSSAVVSALGSGFLLAVLETDIAGEADLDVSTAGVANGDVVGMSLYPGPGRDAAALVF